MISIFNRYYGNTGKYERVWSQNGHYDTSFTPRQENPSYHQDFFRQNGPFSGENFPGNHPAEMHSAERNHNIRKPPEMRPYDRPPYERKGHEKRPPEKGGLENLLASFLPEGTDNGDIILILILLLLYLDCHDDELLIVLAVMALGIFKK